MPATHYPKGVAAGTSMPLLQTLRFVFHNGASVDATLRPGPIQPDAPITHVDLVVSCLENVKQVPTVLDAGADAFRAAAAHAAALSTTLTRVITDNEEFLDEEDLRAITGDKYQVVSFAHRGYGMNGQRIDFVLATGKVLRALVIANGPQDFVGALAQAPHGREVEASTPWIALEAMPGGGRHPAHEVFRQLCGYAVQYAGPDNIVSIEAEGGPNISLALLQEIAGEIPVALLQEG